MQNNTQKYKLMLEEVFIEQNRIPNNGGLGDMTRQLQIPAGIASIDAKNCYNNMLHAIASLVFCSFGVEDMSVKTMLEAIQQMKFFLQTAHGDSKESTTSTLQIWTQELCQGNGGLPGGVLVISIVILRYHQRKCHGAIIIALISKIRAKTAAIMNMDNNNLPHCPEAFLLYQL